MKKNYNIKKTISIKKFISEFGEDFSKHMKQRLLELEVRSVLTRKEEINHLDLKHVEHIQYACNPSSDSDKSEKEYTYGQLIVVDGTLYFSESCIESDTVMESPVVENIFNSLSSSGMIIDSDIRAKQVDDTNIDYVVDSLLDACPPVSQKYIDIVQGMISRSTR
ncbi:hypothetical protein GOM49_04070 [Clostridium bovifaecis]|uniref:Uncharacterized protein n=1 Tax=Clostridium bovifaecis TaxID=2184719 RepID=A0A6I6EL32_9CLOT|nr:hypothetical protein GOM49_04070 [Clostridium bovifaecis]